MILKRSTFLYKFAISKGIQTETEIQLSLYLYVYIFIKLM